VGGGNISLGLLAGLVRVIVRDASAIPIATFELVVSDPWDCRTTQTLTLVSNNITECDASAATCQIN
jgi:hypothetical protein